MNLKNESGPGSVSIKNSKLQVLRLYAESIASPPLPFSVPPRGGDGERRRGRGRGEGSEVGGLLVYSLSTGLTRLYTRHQHKPPPPPQSRVREERNADSCFKYLLLLPGFAFDYVDL